MTIDSKMHGNFGVVTVGGRMDAESTPRFEDACKSVMQQGATHVIADVGRLEYISSMGLRSVLSISKSLESKGGALLLVDLRGLVKQVFELTRLTPLFRVYDSVELALKSPS